MTMKLSPSGVCPKSCTSTMFSWPICVTARASLKKRAIISSFDASSGWMTLSATRLPMTGWCARKTLPIAPEPIFCSTW